MNRLLLLIAAFALVCSSVSAEDATTTSKTETQVKTEAKTEGVAPDNTGKNTRDRKDKKPTADDQSNKKSDVDVTRAIRKAIMAKKGFSVNAQNVKIVTKKGVVTLRGPVDTSEEKDTIETLAKENAGSFKVVNELEVKK